MAVRRTRPHKYALGTRSWFVSVLLFAVLPLWADEVQVISGGDRFQALVLPGGFNATSQEVRIVVRGFGPRRLAELSFLSEDGFRGRYVETIKWAAKVDDESKENYLVFTTSSAAGIAPWHYVTYVFSTHHWRFLCLDEVLSQVTSSDFTFKDSTHLVIEMMRKDAKDVSEHSPRVIDLESLPWTTKQAPTP